MDQSFSLGGFIPLWILGAPLLAALFSLVTTPKVSRSEHHDVRVPRPAHAPMATAGLGTARA